MLKLDYLRLKNLLSILAGMGKMEVEIDFTKGEHEKILLLGDNGSGKTLILSSCTPYRGTNDSRTVVPLEGKEGLKEIHYTYNNDKYVIKHYYGESSSKNKSYVTKNGVELNENGNIRPFNEIIEEELDINPDYFTVGKLGSNVSNFIDYTTADRKKYINKFIPNIDEYAEAFDIVNTKLNDINKQFKSINVKLERYRSLDEIKESRDKIEATITSLEKMINSNDKDSIQIKESMTKITKRLEEIKKELADKNIEFENLSSLIDLVGNSKEILEARNKAVSDFEEKYPTLFKDDAGIQEFKNRIPELKAKIDINMAKIESKKDISLRNDKVMKELGDTNVTLQKRIDSFNEDNIDDLEKDLNAYTDKMNSIKNEMKEIRTVEGFETLSEILTYEDTRYLIDTLIQKLKVEHNHFMYNKTEDDNGFFDRYNLNDTEVASTIRENQEKLNSIREEGNQLTHDLNEINKSSGLLDILEHSEHHEHTKDCPFVPMALNFKTDSYSTVGELEDRIIVLETELADMSTENELLANYLKLVKQFKSDILGTFENTVAKFSVVGIDHDDIVGLFTKSFLHIEQKTLLLPIFKRYNLLEGELYSLDSKINHIKEKIDYNRSFQETIAGYRQDIENNNLSITAMEKSNVELGEEIFMINNEVQKSTITIKVLNSVIDAILMRDKAEEDTKIYDEYKDETMSLNLEFTQLTDKFSQLKVDNERFKVELDSYKTNLDSANRDFYVVESSLNELNLINQVLDYFETIKSSLDIKKGIPLIFTNTYLVDIAERTNELLAMAYDDAFSIEFEVTKKDFNIIVNKSDGTMLEDIALASQGEVSMTNTSLSLAMMANVTSGYNILYLDEVDATLDDNNRRSFLSVLDRQIENLGSKQAFIISHNNEFYSSDVDLILMNGYESKININDEVLMANKNILYIN